MKKKILVTGSTRLAGSVIEHFQADSYRVEDTIPFEDYDVFINNAHVGFEQCALFSKCLDVWKYDSTKLIINISSRAAYPNLSKGVMYAAQKAALDHMSDNLVFNSDKRCRITTLNLGLLNDDLPSLTYLEVCDMMRYIIELPEHLDIPKIGFQHVHNYQDIQHQKNIRMRGNGA